jgi:D-3-phosphoglycerate dehydrogenase / 2-oxoglutarate reductase
MLRAIERFRPDLLAAGYELEVPHVVQVLSEEELLRIVPGVDGWIIGDDPATEKVFVAGRGGCLRAAVKWGVGVDNVDVEAARRLGIRITNTPGMFGAEVADVAMGYVIALARETFAVDRGVKDGGWPKPAGVSLAGKTVALLGFGDIGRQTAKRLIASDMRVRVYDPVLSVGTAPADVTLGVWPEHLEEADFLVVTCALNGATRHLVNAEAFGRCRDGLRLVNVSRGPIVDEASLVAALQSNRVHSAALEVFEEEPLPQRSQLRAFGDRCIFGSHNASNTREAVERASREAVRLLLGFLDGS